MALANLTWRGADAEYNHFDIDIGVANEYYLYKIGDHSIRRFRGLKQLAAPTFTSPLIGPLSVTSLGRKTLEIPNHQLDRTHRYIQLFSFRTAQLDGPALSDIVEVPVAGLPPDRDFSHKGLRHRPTAQSLGLEDSMPQQTVDQPPVEVVAFAYKEAPPVNTAMALSGLSSVIGRLTPLAKKAAAVVTSPQAQNALKKAGGFLANPQNQQMLMNAGTTLLANTGGPGQQGMNTQALIQLLMNFLSQSGALPTGLPQMGTPVTPGTPIMPAMTGANLMGTPTLQQTPMPQTPIIGGGTFPSQTNGFQQFHASAGKTAPLLTQQKLTQTPLRQGQPSRVNPHGRQNFSRARSLSGAASAKSGSYTQEMAFPAVAALPSLLGGLGGAGAAGAGGASSLMGSAGGMGGLTALMPLLQQVMTPQTVQMLLQNLSPAKLLGAVTEGVTQVAKVNLEDKKQDQGHIEKLIANAADPAMEKWAYGQAVVNALARSPHVIEYQRVGRVRLDFANVTPLMLHGRSRVLYHQDRDLALPLTVETPRPIARGLLQVLVKDPETLEILIEEKYVVKDITAGPLEVVPRISREQLEQLTPNEDYLVTVVLAWTGRSRRQREEQRTGRRRRKRLGSSMTQMITLVRDYCFDRIEGQAETVALNDVDRYRAYWHKVWQGRLSKQRRRLTLDCKYYYALERDRAVLARMETVTRIQQVSDTRQEGQLKAGIMLNPERLNELLGQISNHPSLNEEQLAALFNSDNISLFNAIAHTEVKFKGRRGGAVALWIYPEFKIQRILLKQAAKIDDDGHVTELTEFPVHFPIPAKAHFIGVSDE
ncbi:MAG: hypothetical protein QNJ46_05800 [Leptolyngbyaceae cyanobacterium MO_188.B28]|nr:hypothetical protein [Leptolyngbyaceae cyanobacterium MO_188.B28]